MFTPEEIAAWQKFNTQMKRKFEVMYEGQKIILDTDVHFGRPVLGKILILPRAAVVDFVYPKPWACISISDPGCHAPQIDEQDRTGILELFFDDVEWQSEEALIFTEQHALEILNFAQMHWENIELLVIHCNAGISRSTAVGKVLSEIYQPTFAEYFHQFYSPNQLVEKIMNEQRIKNTEN